MSDPTGNEPESEPYVSVDGGTAVRRDDTMVPSVRLALPEWAIAEGAVWLDPQQARRIGLDLIAAASAAMFDTGVRRHAKATGVDGDAIIAACSAVMRETLDAEG